jgi:hypothetical protein
MIWKMTNKDLFEALRTFEKEKGIPMDYMLQNIEKAISVACKNYYYVDKTLMIKEFLDERPKVSLFTRPGKEQL